MRRREFIAAVGGAAAWPLAARAQQPGKLPTIGFAGSGTASTQGYVATAFSQRLGELGWIEGRTVAIEYRWAEGRNESATEIAAEFVRLKVDVMGGSVFTKDVARGKRVASRIDTGMMFVTGPAVRRHQELRLRARALQHGHSGVRQQEAGSRRFD
jgi:hypothetical protein